MDASLGTIIIYARDMQKSAAFYSRHFGFETSGQVVEGLIELRASNGGASILIHQAAKSIKLGQVGVKLSFHVPDVLAFSAAAAKTWAQVWCRAQSKRLLIRKCQGCGQKLD